MYCRMLRLLPGGSEIEGVIAHARFLFLSTTLK